MVLFSTIGGPLITAIAIFFISLAPDMKTSLRLNDIPAALFMFYVFGAIPAFMGGLIFALIRRKLGSGRLTAALSGFLGVLIPAAFIPSDGGLMATLAVAQTGATLGIIPALLTHLAAEKIFGWNKRGNTTGVKSS